MSQYSAAAAKQRANALFSSGKVGAAREIYTEIIAMRSSALAPSERALLSAVHFNRGLCHARLHAQPEGISDFRAALELEPAYFKAEFSLGQLLAQPPANDFLAAVAHLERALDLCRRQRRGVPDTLMALSALAKARYLWHRAREEELGHRALELEHLVKASLAADADAHPQAVRWRPSALAQPLRAPGYVPDPVPLESAEEGGSGGGGGSAAAAAAHACAAATGAAAQQQEPPPTELELRLRALTELFAEQRARAEARAIPDWALDPITLEVMEEAVVTPGGQSYDRRSILECLKGKKECPVTRAPLTPAELAPNVALRKAISEWVAVRPWANPRLQRNLAGEVAE